MATEDVSTVYDTLTGTELWATHNVGERPHLAPVVSDGNVYLSTDDALVALDVRHGHRALATSDDQSDRRRRRHRRGADHTDWVGEPR